MTKPPKRTVERMDPPKREPIFGSGAPEALAYIVSLLITFFILAWLRG